MNDRFKFRVWDNDFKKYRTGLGINNGLVCTYNDATCILEQCAGLKDKNGKLIYEGDIVKETSFDEDSCAGREFVETSVVCFGGGDYPCSFTLKNKRFYRGYALLNYGVNRLELEVIGNIHENPELVEEQ